MNIHITEDMLRKTANRPAQPAVSLSEEAYSALLGLSDRCNVSMRKLASLIILEACNGNVNIKKEGTVDES